MEAQTLTDAHQAQAEKDAIAAIPPALLQRVLAADAILLITITDDGKMETVGIPKHAPFNPGLDASHAMLQAIELERPNLLAKVTGNLTDGDRFRALRAFATLRHVNQEQFDVVNSMLQEFEEQKLPPEDKRTAADYDKMADYLAFAILETTPGLSAPTTEPDAPGEQNPPGIIIPQ